MKSKLINFIRWPAFVSLVLLVSLLIINQILSPGYLNKAYITNFLGSNGPLIMSSIGLSIVLISGGMDISVGGIMSLINVVYITLSESGMQTILILVICILVGLFCGIINGLFVGYLRITPILTTFATSSLFSGIALWIMPSPRGSVPKGLLNWYYSWLGGFGAPILFLLIIVIGWFIIRKSKLGIMLYAVGANKENSYLSGINVYRVQFISYVLAALFYTISAISMTTYFSGGDATVASALTMKAITACVIGGVLLSGGVGDGIGAAFGATSLGLAITTVLAIVKNAFFQDFASGVLMLIAVIGCTLLNRYIANKFSKKGVVINAEKD